MNNMNLPLIEIADNIIAPEQRVGLEVTDNARIIASERVRRRLSFSPGRQGKIKDLVSTDVGEQPNGDSTDPFSSDDEIADPTYEYESAAGPSTLNFFFAPPNDGNADLIDKHMTDDHQPSTSKYTLSSDDDEHNELQHKVADKKPTRSVTSNKQATKKTCCVYCQELFSKIVPHLERKHSEENDVKKFTNLPKGTPQRKLIIDTLRKRGNFLYSMKQGQIISVRRNVQKEQTACPNCQGFFSKNSLRKHYKHCVPNLETRRSRNLLVMSRKISMQVHPKSSFVLKTEVLPVLRDGPLVDQLKNDSLIILYGNKLCEKYKSKHLHKMIRARLRLVSRFLQEMKKINPIVTDLATVFNPRYFDQTIQTINVVAQLNEVTGKYKAPATAFALGTALKYISNLLISEYIKTSESNKKKEVQDFLKLLQTDLATSINKTVSENQMEFKRQKQISLPSNEDIKKLYYYLCEKRRYYFDKCSEDCTNKFWLELAGHTLISIQLFNRRRAGEIERIMIEDFQCQQKIDEQDDIYKSLSEESQEAAKQYVRFTIRGKLARGVPVLLNRELLECVNIILEKRKEFNVPEENPYLFGIPHPERNHEHLNAYKLLVDYSLRCGAASPKSLRGTGLRKHIATQCILLDLKENEVKDLANYLGHAEKIHFDHYRMPIPARDITMMSRLLEKAQGGIDDESQICENLELPESAEEGKQQISETEEPDLEHLIKSNSHVTTRSETITTRSKTNATHSKTKTTHSNTNKTRSKTNVYITERTPTKQPITRQAWITPERKAIRFVFSKHILEGKLPSFQECRKAQEAYPVLQRRTLPVIKAHVSNEIKRRTDRR